MEINVNIKIEFDLEKVIKHLLISLVLILIDRIRLALTYDPYYDLNSGTRIIGDNDSLRTNDTAIAFVDKSSDFGSLSWAIWAQIIIGCLGILFFLFILGWIIFGVWQKIQESHRDQPYNEGLTSKEHLADIIVHTICAMISWKPWELYCIVQTNRKRTKEMRQTGTICCHKSRDHQIPICRGAGFSQLYCRSMNELRKIINEHLDERRGPIAQIFWLSIKLSDLTQTKARVADTPRLADTNITKKMPADKEAQQAVQKFEEFERTYENIEFLVAELPKDPTYTQLKELRKKVKDGEKICLHMASHIEEWEAQKIKDLPDRARINGILSTIRHLENAIDKFDHRFREAMITQAGKPDLETTPISELEERNRRETESTDKQTAEWTKLLRSWAAPRMESTKMPTTPDMMNPGWYPDPTSSRYVTAIPTSELRNHQQTPNYRGPGSVSFRTPLTAHPQPRDAPTTSTQPSQFDPYHLQELQRLLDQMRNISPDRRSTSPRATAEQRTEERRAEATVPEIGNFSQFLSNQNVQLPYVDPQNRFHARNVDYIPKFDGNSKNFPEFIELFNTFVGSTPIIDSHKLAIFRQKLDEQGRSLIQGMRSFPEAYAIILKLHGNPMTVKKDVIKDLAKLPEVKDPEQVQCMIKNLGIIRNRYMQLKEDPIHKDFLEHEFYDYIWKKFPRHLSEMSFNMTGRPERIHYFMRDAEEYVQCWMHQCSQENVDKSKKDNVRLNAAAVENKGRPADKMSQQPKQHRERKQDGWTITQQGNQNNARRDNHFRTNERSHPRSRNDYHQTSRPAGLYRRRSCLFCTGMHSSATCPYSTEERTRVLSSRGMCRKCLSYQHLTENCQRTEGCFRCGGHHSYLICDKDPHQYAEQSHSGNGSQKNTQVMKIGSTNQLNTPSVNRITIETGGELVTRLETPGLTKIKVKLNKQPFEALYDCGSTHCFINEEQMKQLGVPWYEKGGRTVKLPNSTCDVLGIIRLRMQIGVMSRYQFFMVLPMNHTIIIGTDAMQKFRIDRGHDGKINVLSLGRLEELHEPLLGNLPKGCIKMNNHVVRMTNEKMRYFLPKTEATEEMQRLHVENGHLGIVKTIQHFSTKYYTTNQNQLATEVVNGCDVCKRAKKQIIKYGKIGQLGPAEKPLEIIHIDTKGGFSEPKVKLRYLHLAIDSFSRHVWAKTSDGQTAKDFIKLVEMIKGDGDPDTIVTDRYGALRSEAFRDKLKREGIELIHTPTAHPQSNGMVERVGQTIVEKLRCKKIVEPNRSWSALAKEAVHEYNYTIHSSTKYTPAFLLDGQKAHRISEKRINNKQRSLQLQVGDLVYANLADELNKEKLDPVFQGPFGIKSKISDITYEIQLPNKVERVHIGKLKPYHKPIETTAN
ncbi:hypothetical protein BLA29_000190 [Euroglyphus maynei]|uniref:RNA-directed DNA polymerase n=1 Tax=Euroglyphus maynei TaxID=6958 RepID=A0A1Y3AP10_EURMA|nr:hypothetical protein BLA29_000190 [Euroglyphus maynei]